MEWRYRHTVLTLCTLAFFVTFFGRLALSPVVPFVTDDFGVTNAQVGVALTGMWLAYGLTQFPSGALADRHGERAIIALAVGGTVVASLLIAISPWFLAFVASAVLLGGVAGLHYSVATILLSRTFDDMGKAIGVHSMGSPLSGLVAPAAVAWLAVAYGWRPAISLTAVVGVPALVLFLWGVRPTEPRDPDARVRDRVSVDVVVEFLSRPSVAFTVAVAVLATFAVQGLLSFLPTFLVEHHDYPEALAGAIFSALFVVKASANVVVGTVSDRVGRDFALGGCMLLFGVGFAVLVVDGSLLAIGAALLLTGVGSSFFPALDPRFLDGLDEDDRGTGFGLVRTVYSVLGASGPVVIGAVADAVNWGVSFTMLAAVCLGVFAVLGANWALGLGY